MGKKQKKSEMTTPAEILNRLELLKVHLEVLLIPIFDNNRVMDSDEIETASMALDLINQLIAWLQQNL